MKTDGGEAIVRGTGLLIIEVIRSNPNGDPDRESDPRQRPDQRGEISPVSFKRKPRDLVADKNGPVWKGISTSFSPPLEEAEFCILESRDREREAIIREIKGDKFLPKYWDARVFGCTFLEKDKDDESTRKKGKLNFIKTGVVQFGLGVSLAPILIERMTNTNIAPVQEGKTRGMAPLGYRIVQHGVYCMPFFINPTAATKSGCTKRDIDLLLRVIPYAYTHTASYVRPFVGIRHAWYIEHKSALGSCSDFELISALTPKKKNDPESPSAAWEEYDVPTALPEKLEGRVEPLRDLMNEDYHGTARP
ncbi:MAG: type I CRISPR-associated protein Cas7 [Desulfomonile tiedjei]|nr:type I CRISPR-associated protein Cas7 [Desulfomonile tiedjei]